ncbi:MAG: 6-carboxytetrahydropterin synthase QueD [Candidatus Latescibacterota bacterium]
MFELSVDAQFSAAHCLRGYEGDCGRIHGHTFKVTVIVAAQNNSNIGMAMDFKIIAKILKESVKDFDHRFLNEHEYFLTINPTSENIAYILFNRLSKEISGEGISVLSVTVAESDHYRATYRKASNHEQQS